MRRRSLLYGVAFVLLWHGLAAAQQWPASALALRTNGGALKSGDCVRLTLVATEDVPGPLTPTVSYAFDQSVTVEDEEGRRTQTTRRATVERRAGPAFDRLMAGSSLVLDDAFCFGQDSRPGVYDISVHLTTSAVPVARLTTCVSVFADEATSSDGCGFALRGVLRRDGDTVVLDAPGGGGVLSRVLVFRGDALLKVVDHGIAASGPGELVAPASVFDPLGSAPVDLVLQDQSGNRSASVARVTIPR